MAGQSDNKKLFARVVLGILVGVIAVSMLLYLVPTAPGTNADGSSSALVATIGKESITAQELRARLQEITRGQPIPKQFESIYAGQLLQQMVLQKEMAYEADRLGIRATNEEVADRIKLFLPTAFNNGVPVSIDQYTSQVLDRFKMPVSQFESLVRQQIVDQKMQRMITDGISASPAELQEQFRYQNEKIKIQYALFKPEELEAKIKLDETEIKSAYEKNKTKYQVPEKRVVRYALLDPVKVRQSIQISDDQLKSEYQRTIAAYQVPSRAHVQHILLMTVGKNTDAEIAEVKGKAEDVLKQVKKGGKFEDLAKKYSEDPGSKAKGGDLGWIQEGQTVPAFQASAFGQPVGSISDLVKTEYGFHIIKVLQRESAHTQPFEEVKEQIRSNLLLNSADQKLDQEGDRLATAIRKNGKISLDELAKDNNLALGETRPVANGDPILELGNAPEINDAIFRLRQGEVSMPVKTARGYVVLSLKESFAAHQGTLDEVRAKVVEDLTKEKSIEQAHAKADELAKRLRAGEKFESAAKAAGVDAKTSDPINRAGSISGVASGKQLASAFQAKIGDVPAPMSLGQNWLVYRIAEKSEPNQADFEAQRKALTDQVLQDKRSLAFSAFQKSLEDRLKLEGKVKLMPQNLGLSNDAS